MQRFTLVTSRISVFVLSVLPCMAAPNDEEIDKNFSECISKAAESPTYKSTDGGKSARKMLEANCPAPYIAWVHSCIAHGDAKNSCVLKAAISAQAALKMLDK